MYKNCICFVIDESGSMGHLKDSVVKVFNKQIESLIATSKSMTQETRVSVFTFNDTVKNLVFDVDVLRSPDISKIYSPRASTALIDGTLQAVNDLKKIPQIYGDFAFLVYVISDGENNVSNHRVDVLKKELKDLPDNWTIAFLAPDATAVHEAKRWGFPANNIKVWNQTAKGVEDVGDDIIKATTSYMENRSRGIKSTKNLFSIDDSKLTTKTLKKELKEISVADYDVILVRKKEAIKALVESWLKVYRIGSAYYQLTKAETVQRSKNVLVQNNLNGKIYGGIEARELLGLPDFDVKINPVDNKEYRIYVQSTSTNRNLVPGTQLIVLK